MIEKMVLFENQKQLEETRDELERCKRFSFRLYAKELPLELTLSHEENNEVNAVKAILKDMEKGNWPMLHYFRMHCKSDSNPPKILQANAIWCCTIKVDIENSKGQYIEKDKQEATKDGSESTKIQHGI